MTDTSAYAELAGRAALVTGGASGIGKAVVEKLAVAGVRVCIADIDVERAAAVVEAIARAGGDAFAVRCDIGDPDQIAAAFQKAILTFGRLDIVHNNAALLDPGTLSADKDIASIPIDVWDRVMQVTLRGTMLGCRHAIAAMLPTGGGSIINTSSMVSVAVDNGIPAYSTAKAGINLLTQWVAAKYGRQGIRCNAVAPSVVRTPLLERAMPAEYIQLHADATLTPFLGTPEDIADIVLFLASDRSRYLTGQIIRADGGSTVTVPIYARARAFFE